LKAEICRFENLTGVEFGEPNPTILEIFVVCCGSPIAQSNLFGLDSRSLEKCNSFFLQQVNNSVMPSRSQMEENNVRLSKLLEKTDEQRMDGQLFRDNEDFLKDSS
jgi:hypothetical protein